MKTKGKKMFKNVKAKITPVNEEEEKKKKTDKRRKAVVESQDYFG